MPKKFCLACGRLKETTDAQIGYCDHYGIYKETPTHQCSWPGQWPKGYLELRIENWKEHAERLKERAKLLEEYLQTKEETTI